jgi:hypothetical protein
MAAKFKVTDLEALLAKFSDRSITKANELALATAASIIITQSKQVHVHERQEGILESSPEIEVKGNSLSIFIPTEGPAGVIYGPWVYLGSRPDPRTGNTIYWNDGKGDPFIFEAYKTKRSEFLKKYRKTLVEIITK